MGKENAGISKRIINFFKFPNKPKEDLSPNSSELYQNIPRNNEGIKSKNIDYNSTYKFRPLPEVPSESDLLPPPNIIDLPKLPAVPKVDPRSSLATSKLNLSKDDSTYRFRPLPELPSATVSPPSQNISGLTKQSSMATSSKDDVIDDSKEEEAYLEPIKVLKGNLQGVI